MNHGVVEQIDSPNKIYEQPETMFVRDFVGRTIKLRGTIENDTDLMRVRIGNRVIELASGDYGAFRPGAAVEVSMRPEDVLLERASTRDNYLVGHVAKVTYYGDRLECTIHIEGTDDEVVVSADKRLGASVGDRVFLIVDKTHPKLWPL
jgi:putative spermidine/putrescine transport system ATP-binding protein